MSNKFVWEKGDVEFTDNDSVEFDPEDYQLDDGWPDDIVQAYAEADEAHEYQTDAEDRVDYEQAAQDLDATENQAAARLMAAYKRVETRALDWFESTAINATDVREFKVNSEVDVQEALNDMYEAAWTDGRDAGASELPAEVQVTPEVQDVKTFCQLSRRSRMLPEWAEYANAFEPQAALDAFANRSWLIKGVIDDTLRAAVQYELFEHLKGGRTIGETVDNIKQLFEPYVGNPEMIAPGNENLADAYRIRNIIRTETTWAYNQGRLAVGDAAGDYIIGYQYSAVMDERTTETCQTADGLILRKDAPTTIKLTPPLHFNCRSILVFVTVDDRPVKFSTQARIDRAIRLIPKGFK